MPVCGECGSVFHSGSYVTDGGGVITPDRPAIVDELGLPTEYDDGHPRWTYVGHTRHDDAVTVYAGRAGEDGKRDLMTAEIGERGWLGNPFPVGDFGSREEAVGCFTEQFLQLIENRPEYRAALVERVRGEVLGCWCHRLEETGAPDALLCHADVIARVVDRVLRHRASGETEGSA